MIKKYCDICGELIEGKNELKFLDGFHILRFTLTPKGAPFTPNGTQLEIRFKAIIDQSPSDKIYPCEEFCKYCFLDGLYKIDDRPHENKD